GRGAQGGGAPGRPGGRDRQRGRRRLARDRRDRDRRPLLPRRAAERHRRHGDRRAALDDDQGEAGARQARPGSL
ncbi:MAG: DEAD-box ATP-dependent RNA helicase DeaD (CshA), partial [uncultured Gemmatimonadaceae bacterium]